MEPGQREPGVWITCGGVRAVVCDVRDAQIGYGIGRARVDRVELRGGVEWCARSLVAGVRLVWRGGCDKRQLRLIQWLGQRREWHIVEARPPVRVAVAERE